MKKINDLANDLKINNNLFNFGDYIAKINCDYNSLNSNNGKLILVTSINPTPMGEGKTTLSIGLNDSLNKIGKKSIACLREPSLGPVFGRKGGAIGGGKSIIEPGVDINLHFTGDMHAITSANNLVCAIVDNHIFQGNDLDIKKVVIKRCLDICDRSLRGNFVITPASEIMAILCLSKDLNDLKNRISNIIVGYNSNEEAIYVKDLKCVDAVTILLKDAIKPNLVQSKYENPVIVHGGPFANIAHGCSSVIATKLGLKLADYVVTEAGFGSDLGAIKFIDIKCKNNNIYPDYIVLNCTINALKYNGNDDLKNGICNLEYHINNMKKYTDNLIVALNKFDKDTNEDIDYVKQFCVKNNVEFSLCTMYSDGEDGCLDLANKIINTKVNSKKYFIYSQDDTLIDKIKKICINELGASNVLISEEIENKLNKLSNKYDICISKTPSSISDDKNKLGYPKDYVINVSDIKVYNGAGFITVLLGSVLTMPGLTKDSKYLNMKIHGDIIDM